MAQIPNLDNAPINLASIRDQSQKELVTILKNIRGKKCLVIDPKLSGSLSLIVQSSVLKDTGAELHHLTAELVQTDCTKLVYLVRSQIELMKFICSQIHNDTSKGLSREYFVYFVPRRTVVCEKVLEEEKVHNLLTVGEYPLYVVPLDEDILSFELDHAFKECLVDGDTTSHWHVAKAIHKLESAFGLIPHVRAKGKASAHIAEILNRLQAEEPVNTSEVVMPEISTLILLDREVDMITPMLTQLTYEGLLDECLGVNNGAVELDASIMGIQEEGKKIKVPLNSSDKLFKETRDLNFEVVVEVLRRKATSMKQDYTDMTTTNQTVTELKDFVKKLNSLPEITRHINLAQHLTTFTSKPSFHGRLDMEHTILEAQSYDLCFDYIEEMIHKQEPLVAVLRLLILFSVTNSGLPKKNFDYLRREFLHSYGFEHMVTLNYLEKAGFFRKQDARGNWLTIERSLNLVVGDDTANPKDIAYVFSGYAPLSIRLVENAMQYGWRRIEEILKLLPGPHTETKRSGFSSSPSFDALSGSLHTPNKVGDGRRSLVLVVFVGGVTFAEISALRFLSAKDGMAYDVIIGTTKIIGGRTLTEAFIDKLG